MHVAGIPLLVLRIEGPMQSWGLRARWSIRDTGTEPSKSGIIGLLGCVLGYHRDDPRLETELDARLRIGVREDRRGKPAIDYHTATPPGDGIFTTANGKKNQVVKTVVSARHYIDDGAFLVIIDGPTEMLERCRDALLAPEWPIYLGRKSCIPTRPVLDALTTDYASIDDALNRYPRSDLSFPGSCVAHCVIDDPTGNAIRPDATLVRPVHTRSSRHVRTFTVDLPRSLVIEPAGGNP